MRRVGEFLFFRASSGVDVAASTRHILSVRPLGTGISINTGNTIYVTDATMVDFERAMQPDPVVRYVNHWAGSMDRE